MLQPADKVYSLAETFDNFDVKGAAQDASPSLIFGTSSSSSISASLSVIELMSNCKDHDQLCILCIIAADNVYLL